MAAGGVPSCGRRFDHLLRTSMHPSTKSSREWCACVQQGLTRPELGACRLQQPKRRRRTDTGRWHCRLRCLHSLAHIFVWSGDQTVRKYACSASRRPHLSQQPRYFALQPWERTGSSPECGSYGFKEASGVPSLQGVCNPGLCRGLLHRRLGGLPLSLAALHSLKEFEKNTRFFSGVGMTCRTPLHCCWCRPHEMHSHAVPLTHVLKEKLQGTECIVHPEAAGHTMVESVEEWRATEQHRGQKLRV